MKITLKNFKHAAFASEETLCFTASVYVDGTRLFEASNSGKGESNRITPVNGKSYSDIRHVENWVEKQPKIKLDEGMLVSDSLDFYLSRLADRAVASKDLKSLLRKHVVIFDPNATIKGLIKFSSSLKPSDLNDVHRNKLNDIYPDCLIINDLDSENALDLYMSSSAGSHLDPNDMYQKIKAA